METRFNVSSTSNTSNGGQQFPASTFPETFKDFFSMINEDEDHIELVSNVLEDKVIPRYNVRGRNRSSSAKYSNTTSLLPTAGATVRSNSFRVNRNSSRATAGTVTPDFCKHIKYCCLHQNALTNASARIDSDQMLDRTNRTKIDHNNFDPGDDFSDNRGMSLGTKFKFDEMNANSTNFSNYSDDEKSMKLTRKFSVDASILNTPNAHNKLIQHSYDSFETRKCNCDNCSASEFNNGSGDELIKMKATNSSSSYCLMRHNRSINQLRAGERSSSGASNTTYNFTSNSSSTMPEKSTESTALTTNSTTSSTRKQMELNRQKSPVFNRRRASSITLARTIPNFTSPQQAPLVSPAHNPNEHYRYMKSDEPQPNWGGQQQQMNEQQQTSSHSNRLLENREKYTRSKSPNIFNRKLIEASNSAVNKVPGQSKPPQQQRARTASMPAENRKPRLADTRRSAIHCADVDMEYYRLRSFSITSHGICNLGDSMRSRRSRSINSVTSSNSGRDRNNSTSSQHMEDIKELANAKDDKNNISYKIAMLGDSAVGKSSLTYQFTTSEYICAYDLSLDDDYGQKSVSVLLNNQQSDLEIIDHPACEMSVEAFCSTYNIDLFVIVYSIVDRKTFKTAERILLYLKENEMMLTRGAILVGNKTDLERQREVSTQAGRKLAKEIGCKFIEASSGLNHNVDELLVGIVAQVKLNPQRIRNLSEKQRNSLGMTMQQKYKGTTTQDHFSELRRNERNKSNMKNQLEKTKGNSPASTATTGTSSSKMGGKGNKENIDDDLEDETDDERSSDEEDNSDIEKYLNLDDKMTATQHGSDVGSMTTNISRLLKSRRYATPGMGHGAHYGIINSFFNNDSDINNSNNNISSSSCSTPTAAAATAAPSSSSTTTTTNPYNNSNNNKTKTNKRDFKSSYENNKNNPSSSSQPATPKKSNLSGTESDTGERCINKFSNRTKMFLTSFLKFKRSLRVKRRNSNSCSDLFVI